MSHRFHGVAGLVLAVLLTGLLSAPALARNYHIAGGIQYVVQGGKERAKGNEEDARRIYGKAVTQLTLGIKEDPGDVEAWDYLGVAYAELDSAAQAGQAFEQGIEMATAKDDKKLLKRMLDNREHYWVRYFNDAIRTYQKAVEESETDQPDPALAAQAVEAMDSAVAMDPKNPKSYCNLAALLANAGRFDEAMEMVEKGLGYAPTDTCLTERKQSLSVAAAQKAEETGDWAKAAAPFERMLERDPNDADAALRLGEIYFREGQSLEQKAAEAPEGPERQAAEAEAKEAFARSAEGFGKFSSLKPEDKDGLYNYGVALLRAGKYEEAGKADIQLLAKAPLSPDYHSALANAYRGLGLEDPANGHTLMAKILREGEKLGNADSAAKATAKTAGAKSDAAKLLNELGSPDEVRTQVMGDFPVEAWFWAGPKRAVLFSKGRTVSDVSFAQLATPKPAAAKKK